jgi:hypothetical protein
MAAHTHPYIPSVAFMAAFAAFLSLNTANPKQGVLLVIHTSFNSPNGANTFSKSDFLNVIAYIGDVESITVCFTASTSRP